MNLKKGLVIGLFPLAGLMGLANADDYTDLVKLLEAKGIFTHEEAQKLIKLHEDHLAKSETSKGREKLTSADWKRLKSLAELKISGKAYIHYDYTSNSPSSTDREKGEFKVNRAYIDIRKYFDKSGKDYFRIVADIYTDTNGSNNFRLKYAYLNWKINPLLQTEIGLVHRPWIDWEEHHAWFHRFVDKTFIEDSDGAHLVVSADYGIAFKGNYKKASYLFGVYNGEGYHGTEDDKHFGKAVAGRVAYDFTKNLFGALHVAYISNNYDNETDTTIVHPLVGFKNQYFLVAAQYIWDNEDPEQGSSYTNKGYAINGDIYLKPVIGKPITLFGRYGKWNFDSDVQSSTDYTKADRWQFLAGVQYDWNKYVETALAFKHVHYDISSSATQTGKNNKDIFMAAMQVKW